MTERLEFKDQKQAPREGPKFKNWTSHKIKPSNILKAVKKTYKNTEYSFSKDYVNSTHDDLCVRSGDPSLSAQQKFVADFMRPENPTRGILIYHGLGSGKTITSIIVGEAMKKMRTDWQPIPDRGKSRILIVVPVALMEQYKETIQGWGPRQVIIDGHVQNYKKKTTQLEIEMRRKISDNQEKQSTLKVGGSKQIKLERELKKYEKKLKELVEKRERIMNATYEVISHQRFVNILVKRNVADGTYGKGEIYDREHGNPLKKKGTLVIIDEIQRLVSEKGPTYKKLLYSLKYHSHPTLKIVALSATPIYDKPFEAALTMNLLKPRIPFPINKDDFEQMFFLEKKNKEDDLKAKNEDIFKYLCSGYVSYYSGGNPRSFPFKTEVFMMHRMSREQETRYVTILEQELKKAIRDKRDKEADIMNPNDDEDPAEDPMNVFILSQMACNIILPGVEEELEEYRESLWNRENYDPFKVTAKEMKDKKELVQKGLDRLYSIVSTAKADGGASNAYDSIIPYSQKFASVLKLIELSKGPVFIFSNFLDYGVNAFATLLRAIGYEQYDPAKKADTNKLRFAVWSSDTAGGKKGEFFSKKVREIYNSEENKKGDRLKVVLGTRSIMEGVSFMNVRQVHIMDPWWNESRIEQISARAIRNCSHKNLPPSERSVTVYKHFSAYQNGQNDQPEVVRILRDLNAGGEMLRSFEDRTIENYMYGKAAEKMSMTYYFQNLMKQSAVDCGINRNGNLVRLVEKYLPEDEGYILIYRNPSTDKEYVRSDVKVRNISEDEMIRGTYSYMSNKDANFKFLELGSSDSRGLYATSTELKNVYPELIVKEDIDCNKSSKTLKQHVSPSVDRLYERYLNNLYVPQISKLIETGELRRRLYRFIQSKSKKGKVKDSNGYEVYTGSMSKLRKKVRSMVIKKDYKTPHEKLVHDLIFKYEKYGTEDEDQLLSMSDVFLKAQVEKEKTRLRTEKALKK